MKEPSFFKNISLLREKFYLVAEGKEALLKLMDEAEIAEQVFNSNAIENSTLSLDETERILQQIDLDRFISERELFEAKNLARVVEYIDNKSKENDLTLEWICLLHRMLLSNIHNEVAGRFRIRNEHVRVGSHIAPDPKQVKSLLTTLLTEYNALNQKHIVHRISKFHLEFERIHPFVDGNGRIGRLLNNYLLIREGYVPINIKFVERKVYYSAFQEYDTDKKTTIMDGIIGRALANSYHKRIAYLEGKNIITLAEYAKKHKFSHSNLLNKANRQTIEAFQEKGVWKIGV